MNARTLKLIWDFYADKMSAHYDPNTRDYKTNQPIDWEAAETLKKGLLKEMADDLAQGMITMPTEDAINFLVDNEVTRHRQILILKDIATQVRNMEALIASVHEMTE